MVCGMIDSELDALIRRALAEDAPFGDKTTGALEIAGPGGGHLTAKEDLVVCGLPVAKRVFRIAAPGCAWSGHISEGSLASKGDLVAGVSGDFAGLLLAERTALNLLQRMCGIATATRGIVRALQGTGTRIADTRKTTPGLRCLEKYAVRVGGGTNHRMSLSDAMLIKENHIAAVGSVGEAVRRARENGGALWKVEVEVTTLEEYREALKAGALVILLDNMSDDEMARAVEERPEGVLLEASGGITAETAPRIAALGVDLISSGALTHSVPASDLSLAIESSRA